MKSTLSALAVLLSLAPVAALASGLCEGTPCSVSLEFTSGGSISASNGATVTFGSGGSITLGTGGHLALGDGGSITPESADMSGGGSIVLGPGGSIQFGEGGALATGDQGGIEVPADGSFDVASVTAVTIDSDHAVHLGSLHTEGSIEMTAHGNMRDADASTPIHFVTPGGDTGAAIRVISGGDLTWKNIQGPPESITLETNSGSIQVTDEGNDWGTYQGGDAAPTESCDPGQSGALFASTNGGSNYSCTQSIDPGSLEFSEVMLLESPSPQRGGGGAPGGVMLLLLAAAAGLRRRRSS